MLDCQRTSDVQNRLKIDNIEDLKTHQENWLDHLKRMGTYQIPRWLSNRSQRDDGTQDTLMKTGRPRTPNAYKEQFLGHKP